MNTTVVGSASCSRRDEERALLSRLKEKASDAEVPMETMAVWKWLESQGCEDLVSKIVAKDGSDHEFLPSIMAEAKAVFEALNTAGLASETAISPTLFPLMATLCVENRFSDRDKAKKGVEEMLQYLQDENEGEEEERGEKGDDKGFKLNPFAKEWDPKRHSARVEDRCLFLTFSNGHPLTEYQIVEFFTRKFGSCVEEVYVHQPKLPTEQPLFGKVVFTASYIPTVVLEGKDQARFFIGSKPLWCKRYDPRRRKKQGRRYDI